LVRALLAELGIEVWIGDAAELRPSECAKQKNDRNDAQLLLKAAAGKYSPRLGARSGESDPAATAWHRTDWLQMRTRIMNQLQALA